MVLLALVLFTIEAQAMCVATTRTLVQFGVWQCQAVTLGGNLNASHSSPSHTAVRGTLVSGMVLESRSVLEPSRDPSPHLFPGPELPANARASVFIAGNAHSVCRSFKADEPTWLVTTRMCCDTVPATGTCVVPDALPVMEITRPERWRDHEPTGRP